VTGPGGRSVRQSTVRLLAWTVFLVAALATLHGVGGPLGPPPLTEPGRLSGWLDQRQPAEAAFAILRLVALGLAWYLLLATAAGSFARVSGWRSLVRALDAVTVPTVRRMVAGAVGVSVAAALSGPGVAAFADERREASSSEVAAETMRRLPDAPPSTSISTSTGSFPVLRRLPAVSPGQAPEQPQAPGPSGPTWTVRPGDHFWAIAKRVLADAWQRAPTDDEVDPYWRALVAANVAVLRDPANPDLLFPGQVIAIPATAARPGG